MKNTIEYKGYFANVLYSAEDMVLYGKIEGIDDLVTFESENAADIEKEFQNAVDDYLAYCKDIGKEPDKTYKGTFNVRIDPRLHREIALTASRNGITLNQAVENAIAQYVTPKEKWNNNMMDSVNAMLEVLSNGVENPNLPWQLTYMVPNNTYMTSVIPNHVYSEEGAIK